MLIKVELREIVGLLFREVKMHLISRARECDLSGLLRTVHTVSNGESVL
jgi:hypothetical protein